MHSIFILQLLFFCAALQAAIVPLISGKDFSNMEKLGYLELKPNGTLILRRDPNQTGNNLQNLLILRGVLQALKLPLPNEEGESKLNIKIYGDGVEHKFPPLLENLIQRIQTYFSIYRYTDTSRPIRKDELTSEVQDLLDLTTTVKVNEKNDLLDIGEQEATTVGQVE